MNTKRFLAFAISLLLVFAVALPANATQEKKYSTFLVLGDSISTGYGLEGYKTTDPYSCDSYANIIARSLSLTSAKTYKNLAVNGDRSEDLLALLPSVKTQIENAELVVISIGGNDMLRSLTDVASIISGESVSDYMTAATILSSLTQEEIKALEGNAELGSALAMIFFKFSINMSQISAILKESAPDADIVFLKQYNPMNNVPGIEAFGEFAGNIIAEINKTIETVCTSSGFICVDVPSVIDENAETLTNITAMDIHPNKAGHAEIAKLLASSLGFTVNSEDVTPEVTLAPSTTTAPEESTSPEESTTPVESTTPEESTSDEGTTKEEKVPDGDGEDSGCGGVVSIPIGATLLGAFVLCKKRRH